MSFAAAIDTRDGVDVGALIRDVLEELHIAHGEAYRTCKPPYDGAQWSRALNGEAPLDLWRLRHLTLPFWLEFGPRFLSALIRYWLADLMVPYRMARADLPEKQRKVL